MSIYPGNIRQAQALASPIHLLLRSAAAGDPELAELLRQSDAQRDTIASAVVRQS